MQYDIKLVKLVSGDTVIANFKDGALQDPVIVQTIPTSAGSIQLALLPFGFPFDQEINGTIDMKHVIFEYNKVPDELKNKYIEAKSDIKIASTGNSGIIL